MNTRINKRDLLRRIEALETTVQTLLTMLKPQPQPMPDLSKLRIGTPPGWPHGVCGGQTTGEPGINTRLEN